MTVEERGTWVVDRIEGRTLVLVEDASGRTAEVDRESVAREWKGTAAREGTVLRVPVGADGTPRWADAVLDEEARRARLDEAERVLGELKERDPGGDVVL